MRQREKRVLGRFVLLMGGALLAVVGGGVIGVWMQPSIDVTVERELQTQPVVLASKQVSALAKTNDSPDRLASGDLCYYATLHHATGHRFELSVLFLDTLKERFPDSPFV